MQYILGLIIGLIVGIICFSLWKKGYGKYLPLEDALLLKVIFGSVLIILGLICGLIFSFLKKYTILAALIIYALVLLISILFGIYYKTIATKKMNF